MSFRFVRVGKRLQLSVTWDKTKVGHRPFKGGQDGPRGAAAVQQIACPKSGKWSARNVAEFNEMCTKCVRNVSKCI